MVWLYLLAATAGVVLVVPTVAQTLDDRPMSLAAGVVGAGLTTFGLAGAVLSAFPSRRLLDFIAAGALGIAVALIQPEFLAALRRRAGHAPAETMDPIATGDGADAVDRIATDDEADRH